MRDPKDGRRMIFPEGGGQWEGLKDGGPQRGPGAEPRSGSDDIFSK